MRKYKAISFCHISIESDQRLRNTAKYKSELSHLEANSIRLVSLSRTFYKSITVEFSNWENPRSDLKRLAWIIRHCFVPKLLYLLRRLWRSGWLNCCTIGFNPNVRWRASQTQKLSLTRRRRFNFYVPVTGSTSIFIRISADAIPTWHTWSFLPMPFLQSCNCLNSWLCVASLAALIIIQLCECGEIVLLPIERVVEIHSV